MRWGFCMISFVRFEKLVVQVAGKMNWIAAAALLFMMMLTVADVFGRLFKSPIPGTFEIVGFTGGTVIAFALAFTSVEKGHIAVDILVMKLPWLARVIINAVNALVALALFALIAWQSVEFALDMKKSAEVSPTLQMPVYPFVYGIAAGCALLCIVLFVEFIRQLRGAEIE